MKIPLLTILALLPSFCFAQIEFKDPPGFVRIAETRGDLDGDKVDEAVIVYNNGKETEAGQVREVYVLKLKNKVYSTWFVGKAIVLGSLEGGGWGDPFSDLQIKAGQLLVSHYGGGTTKWAYVHHFELKKGRLILSSVEISNFRFEDELEEFTYDVISGRVEGRAEFEDKTEADANYDFKLLPNDTLDFTTFKVLKNRIKIPNVSPEKILTY